MFRQKNNSWLHSNWQLVIVKIALLTGNGVNIAELSN